MSDWTLVSDALPTKEEFGPYPRVEVIAQCNHESSSPWQRHHYAELRFLGRDPKRPIWCDASKPHAPIENDAWFVTHWRRIADLPPPIQNPGSQSPNREGDDGGAG